MLSLCGDEKGERRKTRVQVDNDVLAPRSRGLRHAIIISILKATILSLLLHWRLIAFGKCVLYHMGAGI
jgi:hypothetical protein